MQVTAKQHYALHAHLTSNGPHTNCMKCSLVMVHTTFSIYIRNWSPNTAAQVLTQRNSYVTTKKNASTTHMQSCRQATKLQSLCLHSQQPLDKAAPSPRHRPIAPTGQKYSWHWFRQKIFEKSRNPPMVCTHLSDTSTEQQTGEKKSDYWARKFQIRVGDMIRFRNHVICRPIDCCPVSLSFA